MEEKRENLRKAAFEAFLDARPTGALPKKDESSLESQMSSMNLQEATSLSWETREVRSWLGHSTSF